MNATTTAPIGIYRVGFQDRPAVGRDGNNRLLTSLLVVLVIVAGAWAYALTQGGLPFLG